MENSHAINYCKPCKTPCEKCLNDTHCLTCVTKSHSLLDGKCLVSCPLGYYSADRVCKRCHSKCSACTGPKATHCVGCNKGYTFTNGSCVSQCVSGSYFDDQYDGCVICDSSQSHCKECTQKKSMCIECQLDYGLSDDKCIECCSSSTEEQVIFTTNLDLLGRNRTRSRSNALCCSCRRDKPSGIVMCEANSMAHKLTRNQTVLTPADFRMEAFIYNLFNQVKLEKMNVVIDAKSLTLDSTNILSRLLEYRRMLEYFILATIVLSLTLLVALLVVLKGRTIKIKKLINVRHHQDDKKGEYSLLNTNKSRANNRAATTTTDDKNSCYDNNEDEEDDDETEFYTPSSRFNNI